MKQLIDAEVQKFAQYCEQFNINISDYSLGSLQPNKPPEFIFIFADDWTKCLDRYFSQPLAMKKILQASYDSAVVKMRNLTVITDPDAVVVRQKPYAIHFTGSIFFANEFVDRIVELKQDTAID